LSFIALRSTSLLSKEWIEETPGFEPDGGSGASELAGVRAGADRHRAALVVNALSALRQRGAARLPEG
jgi:hypothetical protein